MCAELVLQKLRVQLSEKLSENFGLEVWEGQAAGKSVIVKLARDVDPSSPRFSLLLHEASILSELRSPLFASLLAFEIQSAQMVMVTEKLPGETVAARHARQPLTLYESLDVALVSLKALEALHAQDILHGDLKPEHLQWSDQGVALCDFGLSRKMTDTTATAIGATVTYAAPEALGLLNLPLGASSDLYSVGVILRELLTPQRTSEHKKSYFQEKLSPLARIPDVPLALVLFLEHLTHPDPQQRYQSAYAARKDLEKLIRVGFERPFALGTEDPRRRLAEPGLAGRQEELKWLREALSAQQKSVIWLNAPSGRGKSFLLEVLAKQQELSGSTVIWARAVTPRDGATPALWQDLGLQLSLWLSKESLIAQRLQQKLTPVEKSRLRQAFSSWSFLDTTGALDPVPGEAVMETFGKTLELLAREQPLTLLFDDMQWSDLFTLRLLDRPLRNLNVVAAFRTDEASRELFQIAKRGQFLELPPLSQQDSQQLLASMGGQLPEEVSQPILQKAQGEPLLLQSLFRGAVETGALEWKDGHWSWNRSVALQFDRRSSYLISERLQQVPDSTRRLLLAGAVLGKSFSLSVTSSLSGVPPEALQEARLRHLVWTEDDRSTFTHDKIREALLTTLAPSEQALIHSRVAELLEQNDETPAQELAFHWSAAGVPKKALPHAIVGAQQAMARFDYLTAGVLWQIAQRGLSTSLPRQLHLDIVVGLARSAHWSGQTTLAAKLFSQALSLEENALQKAELAAEYLSVLSRNCRFTEISSLAVEALLLLDVKVPQGEVFAKASAAKELLSLLLLLQKPRPETSTLRQKLIGKLLVSFAESCIRTVDPTRLVWSGALACRMLYAKDAPAEAAIAFGFASMFLGGMGMLKRRETLNDLARRHAELYPQASGQVRGMSGVTPLQNGDLPTALARFSEAIPLCKTYGDRWNEQVCSLHRAYALVTLGRFEQAKPELRKLISSEEITDNSIPLVCASFLCETGDFEGLQSWADTSLQSFEHSIFRAVWFLFQGHLAAQRRDWDKAVSHLENAVELTTPTTSFYAGGSGAWLATICRLASAALPAEASAKMRQLQAKARHGLAKGKYNTKHWPTLQPHLLREEALQAAVDGHWARAHQFFQSSLEVSDRQGQAFQSAWTLYERGRFAKAAGWKEWEGDSPMGIAAARQLGGHIPGVEAETDSGRHQLAKLERFEGVLEAGHRLVTLESEVLEVLKTEALFLLRCDRVSVTALADPHPLEWSKTLLALCLKEKRAVTESTPEEPSRSMLLQNARSLLMAPIDVEGESVAVLAAWQKSLGGFFGKEEMRLADYLCTLAGAGLENARVMAEKNRAFSALRTSEQRFRGFFEHAGIGTALLDESASVLEENPYLLTLLGGSCVGKNLWQFTHAGDRERLRSEFQNLTQKQASKLSTELRLHRTKGEVVWTQSSLVLLPSRDGEGSRYLLTVADITHRRIGEMLTFLENERRGLAAEIHDELAQGLAALNMTLVDSQPEGEGKEPCVRQAQNLSKLLLEKASNLISSLRNPITEGVDLLTALKNLVVDFSVESEVEFETIWPSHAPFLRELHSLVLYRVVQEGLSNIVQHAEATKVTLELSNTDNHIEIRLQDNGRGFHPEGLMNRQTPEKQFGLLSIRDRVEMIGGRFELTSSEGQGTSLRVRFITNEMG